MSEIKGSSGDFSGCTLGCESNSRRNFHTTKIHYPKNREEKNSERSNF